MIPELEAIVGAKNVLANGKEKARFTHIWKTDVPLEALLWSTRNTKEVSAIMRLCHENNQAVVVHSGVTNLGWQRYTNRKKHLVIALDKMNAIEEVDEQKAEPAGKQVPFWNKQ